MRRLMLGILLLTLVGAAAPRIAHAAWPPEKLENLQVFPQDIGVRDLVGVMRGFALGLGVACIHCHVGDDPNDLAATDFVSDAKSTKLKARVMLRMTRTINDELLSKVPERSDPPIEVTCATCHHGVTKPVSLQSLLTETAKRDGAEAAISRYRRLREEYYGTYSYDFSDFVLPGVAEGLAPGDSAGAIRLLEFNLELYPESVSTLFAMATLHQRTGDNAAAIRALERALEIDPENGFFQQTLERLRAAGD